MEEEEEGGLSQTHSTGFQLNRVNLRLLLRQQTHADGVLTRHFPSVPWQAKAAASCSSCGSEEPSELCIIHQHAKGREMWVMLRWALHPRAVPPRACRDGEGMGE